MTNTSQPTVVSQGMAVTMSNRPGPRNVQIPADRPGVVIFLHGVNDPGANYDHIEQGLCEGLNERLSRSDLKPGVYGVLFNKAVKYKSDNPNFDQWKDIKYDPDTYLYQRTEITEGQGKTHSMFIPFYWGYRASDGEIKGGEKNPSTFRGQYQDGSGNRLGKKFAKGGGMFNNATTNIPAMYDAGWMDNAANWGAGLFMSDYQYSSSSPKRHYYVLAAVRLAMLIREIRRVDPNETVTVMAHSQGTVITLLAQAMLAESKEDGSRCADCVILADSPYSLTEPAIAQAAQPSATPYTLRGKLNTLINIVQAITAHPHSEPPLSQLICKDDNPDHQGRTGRGWSSAQASRKDKDGKVYPFTERDNRGKVYLYFCTEDATVDLMTVKGIGTHGVPDTVDEVWQGTRKLLGMPMKSTTTLKAMDVLKTHRFYQRLWSKVSTDLYGRPRFVGKKPEYYDGQYLGDDRKFEKRLINADELFPPYQPNLYGDEAIRGTERKPGKDKPDYVARDTLLGNPKAKVKFIPLADLPEDVRKQGSPAIMKWYNSKIADPEDQTNVVRAADGYGIHWEREESPNETRARLETDSGKWDDNSYHSAIYRDSNNMRRVAAMDVAIGQARSLDDPDMRKLLVAIADWKLDSTKLKEVQNNKCYGNLLGSSQGIIEKSSKYYSRGEFPSDIVPKTPPKMVDGETFAQREKRQ